MKVLTAVLLSLGSLLGLHQIAALVSASPPVSVPQLTASAALADQTTFPTASSTAPRVVASTAAAFPSAPSVLPKDEYNVSVATAGATTDPVPQGQVLGITTENTYVTREQLNQTADALRALIYQVAASNTTALTNPQIAANGNGVYFGESAAPVTQLPASLITGLTASEVPALNYFPATTSISTVYGGTGVTSYNTGDILYASGANTLARLPVGSTGEVLEVQGGVPTWAINASGSGGGAWATTTNALAIYPAIPSQVVLVGEDATTTTGNILEVAGNALFRNNLSAYGTITGNALAATTSATLASTTLTGSSLLGNATTTALGLVGLANAVLAVNSVGNVIATSSIGVNNLSGTLPVANGGTGSSTLSGLLVGNGTSAVQTAIVSSPFLLSGTTLSIQQANASQSGYLSSTDWNTFNNKISSTSLSSANGYLTYNPTTGVFVASTSPTYGSATSTNFFANNLTVGSLSGLLKGSNGVISVATAGTDYLTGSGTSGDCVQWGASNTLTDSGASCGTGSGSFAYPFPNNATSTTLIFGGGLIAGTSTIGTLNATSSVSLASTTLTGNTLLSNATSSAFAITGTSGALLKTLTDGAVIAAVAGTDYVTPSGLSSAVASAYPFQLTGNSTSTLTQFNGGLTAYASSTIGNGTLGLTINGPAVTTGTGYFAGNVGIGSSTPNSLLSINGGDVWQTAGVPTIVASTSISTTAWGTYVQGRYAYLAESSSNAGTSGALQTFDVSNPASPQLVSTYNPGGGFYFVYVSGKYAYVGINAGGSSNQFQILDISNPSSVQLVGKVVLGFEPDDVYLSGKYAYVVDQDNHMWIIDVSNPASPLVVSETAMTGNTSSIVNKIIVSGKYAYVAGHTTGTTDDLNIYDISNPTSPSLVDATSTTMSSENDIYISGEYLYGGNAGAEIINISNPASPVLVSTIPSSVFNHTVRSVMVAGNYLYVGAGSSLFVFNVSSPASPVLIGSVALTGTAGEGQGDPLYIAGKYLYVGEGSSSFQILDLSGIESPTASIGALDTNQLQVDEDANIGGDIYANGGLSVGISGIFSRETIAAYVASSTQVSPTVADFIGGNVGIGTTSPYARLSIAANSTDSSTIGNTLFTIASSTSSFATSTLFTVLNTGATGVGTTSPFAQFSIDTTGLAAGVPEFDIGSSTRTDLTITQAGNVGIASTSPWGRLSVDTSLLPVGIPEFAIGSSTRSDLVLTQAGTLGLGTSTPAGSNQLAVSGTSYFAGNVGIGTSTPGYELSVNGGDIWQTAGNPVLVGQTAASSTSAVGIAIEGRYAYVVENNSPNGVLDVYDVSNPNAPVNVSSTTVSAAPSRGIAVAGKYAYITTSVGLRVFDVSDPFLPVQVASLGSVNSDAVYLSGKYAYVTTGSSAVEIIDISNPLLPQLVSTATIPGNTSESQRGLFASGRYLYVVGTQGGTTAGFNILDISNPASPVVVSSYTTLGNTISIYVSGRYAYLAEASGKVEIVDVSNPLLPVQKSSFVGPNPSGNPGSILVAGRYAYEYQGTSTNVIDVSNPASPILVGSAVTAANITGAGGGNMALSGKYLYLTNQSSVDSLQVFDISGIQSPAASIGTIDTNQLQVDENANIGGDIYANGGLSVGISGIFSRGTIAAYVASSTQVSPTVADFMGGDVGVGTSTPDAPLSVWGPDAASSTLALNVVNSASTTLFSVFDGGNAQLSGTLTQSSDQRLKTNIASLDASSSLALIDELNPVTFTWIDPNQGTNPQLGFIAQQVQQVFPTLVSTTSATALTPDGTLGLNYIGLISPIVSAIQALYMDVQTLEQSVASFAISITSQTITATNQLCIDKSNGTPICITGDQLASLLAADNQSPSPAQPSQSGASSTDLVTQDSDATDTAPIIQINGANPAVVEVGATYSDLGATITGPEPDLNLGIETFLNGSPLNPIVIDTSAPATDTIDYVVTDQNELTSTSTRTVIIEATQAPSIGPSDDASSTATTTAS